MSQKNNSKTDITSVKSQKGSVLKIYPILTVFISFLLLVVAVFSYKSSSESAVAAKESVKAAKESVKAALESVKAARDSANTAQESLEFVKSLEKEDLLIIMYKMHEYQTELKLHEKQPTIILKWYCIIINRSKIPINIIDFKSTEILESKKEVTIPNPNTKKVILKINQGSQKLLPLSVTLNLTKEVVDKLKQKGFDKPKQNISEILNYLNSVGIDIFGNSIPHLGNCLKNPIFRLYFLTAKKNIFEHYFSWYNKQKDTFWK